MENGEWRWYKIARMKKVSCRCDGLVFGVGLALGAEKRSKPPLVLSVARACGLPRSHQAGLEA